MDITVPRVTGEESLSFHSIVQWTAANCLNPAPGNGREVMGDFRARCASMELQVEIEASGMQVGELHDLVAGGAHDSTTKKAGIDKLRLPKQAKVHTQLGNLQGHHWYN